MKYRRKKPQLLELLITCIFTRRSTPVHFPGTEVLPHSSVLACRHFCTHSCLFLQDQYQGQEKCCNLLLPDLVSLGHSRGAKKSKGVGNAPWTCLSPRTGLMFLNVMSWGSQRAGPRHHYDSQSIKTQAAKLVMYLITMLLRLLIDTASFLLKIHHYRLL